MGEILRRRNIEIDWQNDTEALVGAGLASGDVLVTTPLGQVSSGIKVSVVGVEGDQRISRRQGEPPGAPNGGARRRATPEGGQ